MAGYSGTPLPKKLGIREGCAVAVLSAPEGFARTLGEPPASATLRSDTKGARPLDVVLLFTLSKRDLEKRFGDVASRLDPAGGLWVCWPKRSSGVTTDLDENVVRAIGLAKGLVDNKVCAVDDVWSGLRFVYRLADRPGPGAGTATKTRRAANPKPAPTKRRA